MRDCATTPTSTPVPMSIPPPAASSQRPVCGDADSEPPLQPEQTEPSYIVSRHVGMRDGLLASASPYCYSGMPLTLMHRRLVCRAHARTHAHPPIHAYGEAGGGNNTLCQFLSQCVHVDARSHFGLADESGHGKHLNRTMCGTATPLPRSLSLFLSFSLLHVRESAKACRARFSTCPALGASLGRQTAIVSTLSQA